MKKKYIVKKNHEFQEIIGLRVFIKTDPYYIYFRKNNLNYPRFGISVGKKLGNAVLRNKVRRQIRSMITIDPTLNIQGYDYIIIVKKNYFKNSYFINKEVLLKNLKK
ncbi:ribonuclease P protein component [Spiroplasma chrysopicola]|uniref:Ribonuclease P protein component n=1 Tax=Spiroplasma chrysopicola DF-1 TaxID=1276227 RepID=R4UCH3_9MOLU|nr:ribonuclease P protein component [Spiroplasma chrysopicola]AGM25594.1 ribonuclease P (protein C5) [Spiroplasma chrysopicola DF-1]